MSSLLEQAIIDAKALKDAALKNAEQMVIEKYSDQIKDAVSTLLEQEEEEDPFAGIGGDEPEEPAAEEPQSADAAAGKDPDAEKLDSVPVSSASEVELDLDQIEKRIRDIEKEEGINASETMEADKMDHEDVAASLEDSIMSSADVESLATEALNEIEKELEEEIFAEIAESLKVDIKPQKRGFMAVSNEELDHAVELELARMQDDEVKEELESMRTALSKLKESNNSFNKANKRLTKENKELTAEVKTYQNAVNQLKEKFDAVNTSNAKLLYINRTLDCNSLNERQKKSIVESIAKAEDAKEAKVIYETLQNSMETKQNIDKSPESLNEAVSRRPSLLVRAREEKRTTSADIFADRMQRLAGIRKDK